MSSPHRPTVSQSRSVPLLPAKQARERANPPPADRARYAEPSSEFPQPHQDRATGHCRASRTATSPSRKTQCEGARAAVRPTASARGSGAHGAAGARTLPRLAPRPRDTGHWRHSTEPTPRLASSHGPAESLPCGPEASTVREHWHHVIAKPPSDRAATGRHSALHLAEGRSSRSPSPTSRTAMQKAREKKHVYKAVSRRGPSACHADATADPAGPRPSPLLVNVKRGAEM